MDCDPPAMVDQEASNKVVIISRKEIDTTEPFLPIEVVDELLVLHNARLDCACPSAQTRDSSVDVRCRCNVEVPTFQVASSKEVPKIGIGRTLGLGERTY